MVLKGIFLTFIEYLHIVTNKNFVIGVTTLDIYNIYGVLRLNYIKYLKELLHYVIL